MKSYFHKILYTFPFIFGVNKFNNKKKKLFFDFILFFLFNFYNEKQKWWVFNIAETKLHKVINFLETVYNNIYRTIAFSRGQFEIKDLST